MSARVSCTSSARTGFTLLARSELARSDFTGTGMDRGDLGRDASHGVREGHSRASASHVRAPVTEGS